MYLKVMKQVGVLLLVAAFSGLAACATSAVSKVAVVKGSNFDNRAEAYVVMSVSENEHPKACRGLGGIATRFWVYADFDGGNDFSVAISEGIRGPANIIEGIQYGRAVVLHLEPGVYNIQGWTTANNGMFKRTSCKGTVHVDFKAEAGKITYIGNIHLVNKPNNRYSIKVRDRYNRDLNVLYKKYPALRGKHVAKKLGHFYRLKS